MNNWLGRGIIFIIAGLGGVLSLHYTTSHFKSDRQLLLLNTTRPDFHGFLDLDKQQPATFSKASLSAYFSYFHLVTDAMPGNSQGFLMLGYLYEITGDKRKAQDLLNKAHHLDPSFFFTEYDLGLLLYEQGDYATSVGILQNALGLAPDQTLGRMMNSIIYRQFFSSLNDSHDIIIDLQQAYHDAQVLLIEALAKQKGPQGENVDAPEIPAHIM